MEGGRDLLPIQAGRGGCHMADRPGGSGTLGRFRGVRDNFCLNIICWWPYVFTRSETAAANNFIQWHCVHYECNWSCEENDQSAPLYEDKILWMLSYVLGAIWSRIDEKAQCDRRRQSAKAKAKCSGGGGPDCRPPQLWGFARMLLSSPRGTVIEGCDRCRAPNLSDSAIFLTSSTVELQLVR